jgi:hypothetical protein
VINRRNTGSASDIALESHLKPNHKNAVGGNGVSC